MMDKQVSKPIKRGRLRLFWGAKFFTAKRYTTWWFGGIKFAKIGEDLGGYMCFAHKTPLYRKLKDVEMHLQHNKVTNLKLALEKLNRVVLRPGETFSYWKLLGRPTAQKGYVDGMILRNGGFYAGVGGGLCQMSNLIYWMTIHTPLTVTERHRHGYDVFPDSNRTQPFGSGATCFYNYGDLMIRNDTADVFQLCLDIDDEYLSGAWYCDAACEFKYEVYEKEHVFEPQFWGGYTRHNLLFRRKYDMDGVLIAEEYVTENHALMMYSPLLPEAAAVDLSLEI